MHLCGFTRKPVSKTQHIHSPGRNAFFPAFRHFVLPGIDTLDFNSLLALFVHAGIVLWAVCWSELQGKSFKNRHCYNYRRLAGDS